MDVKRLSGVEKSALVLSAIMILIGGLLVIHPIEMNIPHPGDPRYHGVLGPNETPEHVSKERARIYAGVAVAVGIGIGWLGIYRPKKLRQ
jgi:hypothetical protein